MDYDEIDILTDIYADVLNYIEHIQTSRKRMMNIKNTLYLIHPKMDYIIIILKQTINYIFIILFQNMIKLLF